MSKFKEFILENSEDIAKQFLMDISIKTGLKSDEKLIDKYSGANDMKINYYLFLDSEMTNDDFSKLKDYLEDHSFRESNVRTKGSITGDVKLKDEWFTIWFDNKNSPRDKPFLRIFRSSETPEK